MKHLIKTIAIHCCFLISLQIYAAPGTNLAPQVNGQISRTVNQEIHKNLSENIMSKSSLPNKPIFDRTKIKEAQMLLNNKGYNAGVVDGIIGKKTRKAIRQFQKDQRIKADGTLTESLLAKLRTPLT